MLSKFFFMVLTINILKDLLSFTFRRRKKEKYSKRMGQKYHLFEGVIPYHYKSKEEIRSWAVIRYCYDLPFEIIATIVKFLFYKDKINCIDAFSSWRTALEESLWNNINISCQNSLDGICNIESAKHSVYKRNGRHVRALTLNGNICIADDQLLLIQQLLPNLDRLYCSNSSISEDGFGTQADWRLWESLTQLHVDLSDWEDIDPIREFMRVFPFLPNLKILNLDQDCGVISPSITLEDIDKIHDYMPHLESIRLEVQPPVLTADDLVRIIDVTPAPSVRSVHFNVRNSTYGWLCYFAFKYPSLQVLEELTFEHNDTSDELASQSKLMLRMDSAVLKRLNTVKINVEENSRQLEPIIWKLFRFFDIPVRYIDYFAYSYINTAVTIRDVIKESFNSYSKTLETLYIKECTSYSRNWIITESMDHYPCLVDMYIDVRRSSVALDVLLDHCVSLKRLKVDSGLLSVGPDSFASAPTSTLTASNIHSLRMLIIGKLSISASILEYISFRCRRLEHMCLSKSTVSGDISENTGSLVIDMSYTHLQTLQLHQVLFTTSLNANIDSRTINLICISENLFEKSPYCDRQIDNESAQNGLLEIYKKTSWFYTVYNTFCRDEWSSEVWNLARNESEMAIKYFSSFKSSRIFSKNMTVPYTDVGYFTKKNWSDSLPNGYVMLQCGSLERHTITGKWFSNEHTWQKMFDSLH
ncbi:hypothetical protein PHYBLDRAFT_70937 [Phycomyces blakesleeanus NRRL 1555(-)]|uniref:F-box domain-containing protein n=1 Tax=Phycomyces blakesleeanus (strain ATCC 8743b / DSM 1359 / FGSC 10004 / NBRC 33097 / NRRL 1555) TaxID=763407 RepID=A0A167JQ52_PHYB8|nr:hypothetical protein PHYBLDRAFT_70937 [Phycomyces blakesleeanus NRRL 1555(-)]OAD66478.1 hypothetical protein PHYBLDRAFT_70937 [Phycomyces blakesleeanus NRRL 1555(-)]|eukprot:XP_018284518.1 hypothetical protein PHYBLDRAFT_70937 [Phycomyces blakesleeanus NRRL 1555(-)]